MNRRFIHSSAVALRWLVVALLLAIPVGSGIAWTVESAKHKYVQVFGRNVMGEPRGRYVILYGEIIFEYSSGWEDTPPPDAELCNLPGIEVTRTVITLTGQTRGDPMLDIRVRWWLLLLANIPPLLLAIRLAWPMLRRRHKPGRCPVCGYDLRATPDRCPECGRQVQTTGVGAR